MWLFHLCICNNAASIINDRTHLRHSSNKPIQSALYFYCYGVDYLLATYITKNIIAEAEHDITS